MDNVTGWIALAIFLMFAAMPEELGKNARRVVDGFYATEVNEQ